MDNVQKHNICKNRLNILPDDGSRASVRNFFVTKTRRWTISWMCVSLTDVGGVLQSDHMEGREFVFVIYLTPC
jgi:hypothetical protein